MKYLITSSYGQRIIEADNDQHAEEIHDEEFGEYILDGLTRKADPDEIYDIGVSNA